MNKNLVSTNELLAQMTFPGETACVSRVTLYNYVDRLLAQGKLKAGPKRAYDGKGGKGTNFYTRTQANIIIEAFKDKHWGKFQKVKA